MLCCALRSVRCATESSKQRPTLPKDSCGATRDLILRWSFPLGTTSGEPEWKYIETLSRSLSIYIYIERERTKRCQERKFSPKRKFLGRTSRGHPGVIRADIPAHNFGQGGQNPEKKQAFRRGHPWPEGADVHDPKGFPKTSVRKTLGWISVPQKGVSLSICLGLGLSLGLSLSL